MMSLVFLVQALPQVEVHGDAPVLGLQVDSRKVQPGDLFVALRGTRLDGHAFLEEAVRNGASALLVSDPSKIPPSASAWAVVPDTREALWRIAKRLYNDPSQQMTVVGITGTNGKTTTAHYLKQVFLSAGYSTLMVGTLGAYLNDTPLPHEIDLTTPEVYQIQALLAQAFQRGAQACVMEVSSHALHQHRADGIAFDVGVFTNLTQDHLDYHGTMEAYAEAKLRLFTDLAEYSQKPFRAVINLDTEWGAWFGERARGDLWTYGTSPSARVRALAPLFAREGIHFMVEWEQGSFPIHTQLHAPHNLYNALASVATALSLGLPIEAIQQGVESLQSVPGRFERVAIPAPFEVVVDFAHTPDALRNLLQTARQLQPTRLTVAFGCGGDRDPLKRPLMGAIAAELADRVIITSDNPRTEDPMRIIEQILEGIPAEARDKVRVEPDRRQAIYYALETAQPGELVVLAGKGHEPYQIIGTTKYPFSDRQVVLDYWEGTHRGAKRP